MEDGSGLDLVAGNAGSHHVVAVDTHAFRVANRTGLASSDMPKKWNASSCR